ncbi:MAG: hypothetical protein ACI91B_002450 [Planctomycetota bacterium]|jgi:hypothetical protein
MAFCMATQVLRPSRLLALCSTALILALPVAAQKVMQLHLKDGRVLVGKVKTKDKSYEVTTYDGSVTVAFHDVAQDFDHTQLLNKLRTRAKTSGDSAFAHLNLAKVAREYGLTTEMWRHLDKTIKKLSQQTASNKSSPVHKRLRDYLAQLEPELMPRKLRQAPLEKRVQYLLRRIPRNIIQSQAAAIEELLVREPGADQYLRIQGRRNSNERQRIAALSALQRRKVAGNDRFVLRTTVFDRSNRVREAAVKISKPTIDASHIVYMAGGLANKHAKVRVRTAKALADLGHREAIQLLVKAGPHAASGLAAPGGDGSRTRAHVAFITQQAYIRDFDVEVAQAAFIADPKVDVVQSGSVLDVTVAGVYEVRTIVKSYRAALKQLTKNDPGKDPRLWGEWLAKLPPEPKPVLTGKH